jgi:Phospholipase_D-nuclease N-terminal/Short C-terminal domain
VLVAADYPFLDVLWTMILFFFWIAWIWTLIVVISDVFRRDDTSGWTKALWTLFVIFLPFLGVLVYLIAEGKGMGERRMRDARAAQSDFDSYVRDVAGSGGAAAEIEKAKQLLDNGAISQDEFERIKAKALS